MKRIKRFEMLGVIFLFTFTWMNASPNGAIIHQPIQQHPPTEPIVIDAMVSAAVEVDRMDLFYRRAGEEGYIDVEMDRTVVGWQGVIPPDYLAEEGIEYFVSATLVDETVVTFPEDDPQEAPIFVQIVIPPEPEVVLEPRIPIIFEEEEILIFSPEPGSSVSFDNVLISASLFKVDSVDVSSVRIYVDGADVTPLATVGPDLVIYEPLLMREGVHRARINVNTLDGRSVAPQIWLFNATKEVVEEEEPAFTYRGRVNSGYSLDRIDEADPLSIGQTTASFTGEWRSLRFKSDVKFTTEEDPFKQPRNRYRFNLIAGRYLSLNLGDFNTRISRFTLDGKRVRGFDADIRLGFVNLHVVSGELDRRIQGRPRAGESYKFEDANVEEDSVTYKLSRKGYAFRKDIFSGRLSFGSGKIFQLGFNWLKAKDDIRSVDIILENAEITVPDSSGEIDLKIDGGTYTYDKLLSDINAIQGYDLELPDWAGDSPQDNIVIGSDAKLSLFKRAIGVEVGWAFSLLNKDIRDGAMTKEDMDVLLDDSTDGFIGRSYDDQGKVVEGGISLDDIPIDPSEIKDFLIWNQNTLPIIPVDIDLLREQDFGGLVKDIPNMPSIAYYVRGRSSLFNHRLAFDYSQVGPEFNSLGNPYIQKNNREYSVSDRVGFFRNRLLLNLMYRHQDDNILRTVTDVTTTNTFTTNLGIYPGGGLPSVTLSYRSQDRDNGKTTLDTVQVDKEGARIDLEDLRDFTNTLNTTFGISHRLSFFGSEHNITVNYISLAREDQFVKDRPLPPYYTVNINGDTVSVDPSFVSPNLASNVTSVSVVTAYPFPLRTSVTLSINNSTFGLQDEAIYDYGKQGINSFSISGTYDLFDGRLKLSGGLASTLGSGNEEFSRFGIRGGFNYRITDFLRLRFDGGLRSKKIGEESKSSTLLRTSLNYSF